MEIVCDIYFLCVHYIGNNQTHLPRDISTEREKGLTMNILPSSVLTSTFILTAPSVKALHTFLLTSKNINMVISHCYDIEMSISLYSIDINKNEVTYLSPRYPGEQVQLPFVPLQKA